MVGADERLVYLAGVEVGHHEQEHRQQQEQQELLPFETTTVLFGNNGYYDQYECNENALPRFGITDPKQIELHFQYFLYEIPTFTDEGDDTIVQRSVRTIESYLTKELSKLTLHCKYTEESENYASRRNTPFQVSKISPFPVDQVTSLGCPIDKQRDNVNCYMISAGFTPSVFYITDEIAVAQAVAQAAEAVLVTETSSPLQSATNNNNEDQEERTTNTSNNGNHGLRHRSLENSQTKQELYRSYGPILDDLLGDSGGISAIADNIEGTEFHGFVANPSTSAAFGDHDILNNSNQQATPGDGTEFITSALANGANQNQNSPSSGFMVGIFMICTAAILLAVFVILSSRRRGSKHVLVRVTPPKNNSDDCQSDDDSIFEGISYNDDQEVDTNLQYNGKIINDHDKIEVENSKGNPSDEKNLYKI